MSIRAVIWDFGGVIVRTEDYAPRTELAAQVGLTREQLEEAVWRCESGDRATLGQITHQELWQDVCTRLKLPIQEQARVQERFWGGDRLDTELIAYIRSLRPHYKTALLSNAFSDLRRYLDEQWQILDAFDEVIISAEVGLMKPDPSIFRLVVDRLGVAPSEAVFIDDFPLNVRGAREFGLHAIRFQSYAQVRQELETLLKNPLEAA